MKAIFTSPQIEALKTLQQIWPTEKIVLIGASEKLKNDKKYPDEKGISLDL